MTMKSTLRSFILVSSFCSVCLILSAEQSTAGIIYVDNRRGSDAFDGSEPEPIDTRSGPVKSIRRATLLAKPSDTIVLANTGVPYFESISLTGSRHSGIGEIPFRIVGNGSIVDGSRPVPAAAWKRIEENLWKMTPWRKGHYQLLRGFQPIPEHRLDSGADSLDSIPPGSWSAWRGSIYYRAKPLEQPEQIAFRVAYHSVGLTFYKVQNVEIRDITFRHFRLDGLNAPFTGLPINDGDALFQAVADFQVGATIPPSGLVVTTLEFFAFEGSLGAAVEIVASAGNFSISRVLSAGVNFGTDVTGTLGSASIKVVECAVNADCDDGNVCNGAETCLGGTCQAGTPLNCDDGNPCTDDDCVDNKCVNTTEEDGTECDDGLFCNGEETCTAGVCGGSTGDPCRGPDGDDNCAESCDEKMGNCEALDPDGSACDDDDACTENDQCTAGSCGGTAVDCSGAGDQCNTASCDPNGAEGNCGILTPVTNGTPCSDGNACTTVDTCSGGVCVGGAPANCDDGSDCTTDGCDSLTGCTNTPLPLGTPCGDPTDTICNGADSCDATGTCQDNFATDGTSCEDGLVCNGAETCLGGLCTPGTPIPGCCKNDADCDNGDVCDGIETCVGNICVSGTPLTCSDGNVCTDDLCDPVTGCFFPNNTAPCDDGLACNEGETCTAGVCGGGSAVDCTGVGADDCNDPNTCDPGGLEG
ncbi:MAG: hypothetical protein IH899_14335, partial [Planctomycetes bacterium]|nr:hypothetical protein [Planctomycetota bacterium]